MVFHRTRLLWLNGFTGLEIILAHCSRSAQGAGPFHYDLAKRWSIQQATCRPERVYASAEIEGTQIAVEDFPIIAHLANDRHHKVITEAKHSPQILFAPEQEADGGCSTRTELLDVVRCYPLFFC